MNIATLDINDSNLQLWSGGSRVQSPGYALLDGREYRFGTAARQAARLRPRDINTRFWWQLSTEPLQPALGPARHSADLVHAHLLQLHTEAGQPGELLLAVSGSMQREQLALLLGIAQQCPFDAVGLVNRSVALGSLYAGSERLFHLEIQLHQAVLSELARGGGQVELRRAVPLPGCGLLQLQERLVECVAAAFIRQTRFDPRRKAGTEQQLYDALPDSLRTLQGTAETNLEVNGYRARISSKELLEAGQRLFDSAAEAMGVQHPDDQVIVDPVAALLPGLDAHIANLQVLPTDALPQAMQQHREQLLQREQALTFVNALPCVQQPIAPAVQVLEESGTAVELQRAEDPSPTHVLQGTRARALTANGTALDENRDIYQSDRGWQLRGDGALVNGTAYTDGQLLTCGDIISTGAGEQALLIQVIP